MAKKCQICGRGAQVANSRSKSNIATKRLQKPNLHTIKIGNLKLLACTKCIKTMNKQTPNKKRKANQTGKLNNTQ